MMHDLVPGVLREFIEAAHTISYAEQHWADDGCSIVLDHNLAQAAYNRESWALDGVFRKKARDYMRDYNKRPARMAKRREYQRARKKRQRLERERTRAQAE